MNRHAPVGIAIVAALVIAAAPAPAGECISATTSSTIVTPDGATHDPGTIEVCLRKRLGPTVAVMAIAIDGDTVGNFMSRTESVDRPGLGSFIQFRRTGDEGLLLEGFTLRRGMGLEGFRMQTRIEGRRPFYPDLALDSDHGSEILRVNFGQLASTSD